MQASAERIEVGEAGLHAADRMLVLHAGVHPHHHVLEHGLDRLGFGGTAVLQDRKDAGFSAGQNLTGFIRGVVRIPQDVGARVDQGPQDRLVPHDRSVVCRMCGMRHRLDDVGDHARPADPLEVALGLQPLDDDRGVDSLAGVMQVEEVAVERLQRLVREILGPDHKRDVVADVRLEKDAAEHSTLGVHVGRAVTPFGSVRRRAEAPVSPAVARAVSRRTTLRWRHEYASLRQ